VGGGVTVTKATLHTADERRRKDVRVGDTVLVRRAGDVIPEIVSVLLPLRPPEALPFSMPDSIPGQAEAQRVQAILHFASRRALDIEGLGEKLVAQFAAAGMVRDASDLYDLQMDEIAALERLGEKSAQNLLRAIDRSRHTTLARFLYGLGIREVGEATARQLASHFGGLEPLMAATPEQLEGVPDVGPAVAASIHRFFQDPVQQEFIARLRARGLQWPEQPPDETRVKPLDGVTVVLTGTLSGFTREEASEQLRALGAKVAGSVSARTHFVVAGAEAGSKAEKAAALGVPVLDEAGLARVLAAPENWQAWLPAGT
jgi:DNA ligase (NAD+)